MSTSGIPFLTISVPIQLPINNMQTTLPTMFTIPSTIGGAMPLSDWNTTINTSMNNKAIVSSDDSLRSLLPSFKKIRNVRKSDKFFCTVCGDRPSGYHYSVLSCNGCKTFFRRTILANRTFRCMKGGNCQFDKEFRCACRACRMDKCIRAGMNQSMIQYPSTRKHSNHEKDDDSDESGGSREGEDKFLMPNLKHTEGRSTSSNEPEEMEIDDQPAQCSTVAIYRQPSKLSEQVCTQIIDQLVYREEGMHRTRTPFMPPLFIRFKLRELLRQPCLIGRKNVEMDSEMKAFYAQDPFRFWMAGDLYLQMEFAKSFETFMRLSESDQLKQLSHVCGILQTSTQAYYSYADKQAGAMTFPDGMNAFERKLEQMKAHERENTEQFFREQYCRPIAILKEMRVTPREFAIIKVIALFSPTEFEVSQEGRQLMETQRNLLLKVLHMHCQINYGAIRGADKMAKLLLVICLFKSLAEKRREHLLIGEATELFKVTGIAREIYLQNYK